MKTSRTQKGTKQSKNRNPSSPKKPGSRGNPSSAVDEMPPSDLDAIAERIGDSVNLNAERPNASPPSSIVGAIQWPSAWDPTEGWPSENDRTPTGRTFAELAARVGTTVEAVSRKLGKGAS